MIKLSKTTVNGIESYEVRKDNVVVGYVGRRMSKARWGCLGWTEVTKNVQGMLVSRESYIYDYDTRGDAIYGLCGEE